MAPSQKSREPLPPQSFPGTPNGGRPKFPPRKGQGPRPARHIPWPEIFKHHISVLEGHLKMIDMVRKHTIEGSGNYRTICEMINRTKQILYESKTVARTFVPPADQIEQVPLGSSSESMYPGYAIKEHKYGEAAQTYGNYVAEAKRRGEEIKPEGVDYKLGQSKGHSSLKLEQMRVMKEPLNGSGSGSDSRPAGASSKEPGSAGQKQVRFSDVPQEASKSEAQMFFMDPKPTPVDLPTTLNPSQKRKDLSPDPEPAPEPAEAQPSKKAKKSHAGPGSKSDDVRQDIYSTTDPTADPTSQTKDDSKQAPKEVPTQYEDITAEVDKRLKDKEEKRKHKDWLKEEKKRKRDSEGSATVAADAATTDGEKPKKKKKTSRKSEDSGTADKVSPKKHDATDGEGTIDGSSAINITTMENPNKKKVKASHESTPSAKTEATTEKADNDSPRKKQKRKKTLGDATGQKDQQGAGMDAQGPSPPKRSLAEDGQESQPNNESPQKKKKAKISKSASTSDEVVGKEKAEKRPVDEAEVGEVEDEDKKKKRKKRKIA
ncbi:MAG: hypothetical protein Q9213_004347 [Squamulea squamosa]